MTLICIALLVIIGATYGGEYCASGGFTQDSNGDCKFLCGGYGGSYLDIDELSFDLIKDQCPNVRAAAELPDSDCNSVDDLVYADGDDICQCPLCKCSMEDKMGETAELLYYQSEDTFSSPTKSCYNCTCVDMSDSDYFAQGTMVNVCEELTTVYDPDVWNDYNCPPTECEATKSSDWDKIKLGGEFWYEDVDADEKCETYCYCDGTNGKTCRTGWSNIIDDDKMVNEIRDDCGYNSIPACYDMDKESYVASRMFTTDDGPTCYGPCPKCNCDGRNVGETWYAEFQDDFDYKYGYASCAECTCRDGGNSGDYASCDYIDFYKIGEGSCPQKQDDGGLSCFDAYYEESNYDYYYSYYGDYGGVDGTDEPTTTGSSYTVGDILPGLGSTQNCSSTSSNFGSSMSYCEWTKSSAGSDGLYYSWGCGVGALCEAYMGSKCYYADFEYTLSDCYGNTEKQEVEEYRYCCKTDNCNKVDIEASSSICEANSDFEDLYKGYYECISDSDSPVYKYGCADIDEIKCSALTEMFKYQAGCMCDVYGGLVKKVSDDTIDILQDDANAQMETFSLWNDAFGCNINLECKLSSSGSVLENNSGSSGLIYSVALMWALLPMLYMVS